MDEASKNGLEPASPPSTMGRDATDPQLRKRHVIPCVPKGTENGLHGLLGPPVVQIVNNFAGETVITPSPIMEAGTAKARTLPAKTAPGACVNVSI